MEVKEGCASRIRADRPPACAAFRHVACCAATRHLQIITLDSLIEGEHCETLTRLVAAKGSRWVALAGLMAAVLQGQAPQPTEAQCRAKEGKNKRQCRRRHRDANAPGGPSVTCGLAR